MKSDSVRNGGLALIGLAALTIYILACTSFSPDDKKVLYPAFDPQTGGAGIALYDRETGRSRMVFVPLACSDETNDTPTPLLRAQWLGNGRTILASWALEEDGDRLDLAVVPVTGESAVRLFAVAAKEPGQMMMMSVPIAGQNAFLRQDKTLLKLNLSTGVANRQELTKEEEELVVYPGLDGESVFYLVEANEPRQIVFGRLDPRTLARSPTVTFTNDLVEGSFFAYSQKGDRVAFVEETGDGQQLVVVEAGKRPVTRLISAQDDLRYGNAVLLERKDLLVASYMREQEGTHTVLYGLLEIPIKGGAIRDTVLIRDTKVKDDFAPFVFQVGVSHDGTTAAVSSMYLACMEKELKAEDCALFFVELGEAKRKVKRVPIPIPSKRPQSIPK